MKRTMLYNWHQKNGAKMTRFAGWDMPIQYTGIRDEHNTVREKAGIFDLSHMGRIRIRGHDRVDFIQYMFTNDVSHLSTGGIHYGFLCNPSGGVKDDVTVYMAEDYILLVVNAVNTSKIYDWLMSKTPDYDVEIEDSTLSILMMAIQGPLSVSILNDVAGRDFSDLKRYHFNIQQIHRAKAVVSRTGYTGEDGFEIYCGSVYLQPLWERFLEAGSELGLKPIGLGARDTLRTEACFPLYGNELDEDTTPLAAELNRFVVFSKRDFIGKTSLQCTTHAEFTKKLVCFEMMDRSIPRKGCPVAFKTMNIGKVTTGTFSPTLKKGIGMAYVDQIKSEPDSEINIKIKHKFHPAVIRQKPLYKRRKS